MSAILGHGTTLQYHNGSAYVDIGAVTEIQWSGAERDIIDVSAMDDATMVRNYIGGRVDPGEITFSVNQLANDTDHDFVRDQLLDAVVNEALDQYKLIFSTSDVTWSFTGVLKSYETDFTDEDIVKSSITIKISGKPTIA